MTEGEAQENSKQLEKVMGILRKDGPKAYEKALKALLLEDRESWEEWVEEDEYQPTAEGLLKFIYDHVLPFCASMEKEALHHDAIKAQASGEGITSPFSRPLSITQ